MNKADMASGAVSLDTPLWAVVPAAGVGLRLGGDIAKQYQLLDGVSMLQRTVDGLLALPYIEKVIVVLADDDQHWQRLEVATNARVLTTGGGETRAVSVLNGLDFLLEQAPANTWVMVHDAARPLVAGSDIQRLANAVYNSGAPGGLLATPVQDTIKLADSHAAVSETIDRSQLWQAQTPQMFRSGQLRNALHEALQHNAESVTDEASAMELAGVQALLVEALQPNFKLTRPVDWYMATALLQAARFAVEWES